MEYIDGTDAAELLANNGPLTPGLAIDLIAGAGAALDHAWRKQRITHRDVKPANILVGIDDAADGAVIESVKLADFGIAKAAGEATSLTSTGMTVGTMQYISPEAIEGEEVDNRSDLYSLGCTAFHLLTGRPPFTRTSIASTMSAHLSEPVPLINKVAPSLPEAMDAVFERTLSKNPADRFQSCAEFIAALQEAAASDVRDPAFAQTMAAVALPNRRVVESDAPTMLRKSARRTVPVTPKSRSRTAVVLAAVAGVLAIAVVSLATYMLTRGGSGTTATPGVSSPVTTALPTATTSLVPTTTPPVTITTSATTTEPTLTATSTTSPPSPNVGGSGMHVSYTVEADTPNVEIAYAPGEWQRYTLEYSNLAGRYAMSIQATPEKAENMYIAVMGSTSQHCRIRVSGQVVAVDNGTTQAVCQT
jgi:serine/threonine-protein kinase